MSAGGHVKAAFRVGAENLYWFMLGSQLTLVVEAGEIRAVRYRPYEWASEILRSAGGKKIQIEEDSKRPRTKRMPPRGRD